MRKICFRDGPIKRVRHGLDGKIDAMLAFLLEIKAKASPHQNVRKCLFFSREYRGIGGPPVKTIKIPAGLDFNKILRCNVQQRARESLLIKSFFAKISKGRWRE